MGEVALCVEAAVLGLGIGTVAGLLLWPLPKRTRRWKQRSSQNGQEK